MSLSNLVIVFNTATVTVIVTVIVTLCHCHCHCRFHNHYHCYFHCHCRWHCHSHSYSVIFTVTVIFIVIVASLFVIVIIIYCQCHSHCHFYCQSLSLSPLLSSFYCYCLLSLSPSLSLSFWRSHCHVLSLFATVTVYSIVFVIIRALLRPFITIMEAWVQWCCDSRWRRTDAQKVGFSFSLPSLSPPPLSLYLWPPPLPPLFPPCVCLFWFFCFLRWAVKQLN